MVEERGELPAVHEAWLPREHALHRPRHGGRQLTALLSALVFFVTPTMLWVLGGRPSEIENHPLAGLPGISEGWGVFTGLPGWATDQLVFRATAIQAADDISRAVFGEPAPLDQGGGPPAGPLPGETRPEPETDQPDPGTGERGGWRVVEGTDGWLYLSLDSEAKCEPARPVRETVHGMTELRRAVEASGRQFVFVIAPDKTTMVPQHLPERYPYRECSRAVAGDFWRLLTGRGRALDLRPPLASAAERIGRPAYASNDTHWRDEGSIVLTRSLAEAIRPGITDGWVTRPDGTYTAPSDLPTVLGRREEKTNMRYELRPDGRTNIHGPYIPDTDTPVRTKRAPLPGMVEKPTLIFGDSFVNTSSSYLPAAFSDLTMLAYPSMSEHLDAVVQEFVDAEVVVVQSVERAVAGGWLPYLDDAFIERVRAAMAARPVR
ncbi:alginate O-acetyltransferase AlgX-related protein [Amycolatopsis cihanbeyliensis]|uniref:alginate O-acetyltransferase AlgX-related protein n=1 Tax=Amycolatopsis cihanbeyliensis TaxID=1128664 RepID=UPI00319DF6C6